ncbi:MAG: 50S ribosomal protein L21 [Christensenellales bacterium]
MYAIVEAGGKQHKAEVGKYFKTERVNEAVGAKVDLKCLLFVDDQGNVKTGADVKNIKVVAEVLENGKDDKVVVYKYKAKKNEHVKQGHRQPYSKLKVVSIG